VLRSANGSNLPGKWRLLLRAFFFFMFVNAAVVFAPGPHRWFGALGCAALLAIWFLPRNVFGARKNARRGRSSFI
jgi:hypothetical protein